MKRSRPAAEEKWRGIIAAQEASGKTAAGYCRKHRVGMASFYAWKRRLGRVQGQSAEVKFVELKTVGGGVDGIEVVVGRRHVLVRRGFDRALFAEVVGVLEEMAREMEGTA
jgi:hypothetical protein